MGRWADWTNESSTKRLMFQVLFFFENLEVKTEVKFVYTGSQNEVDICIQGQNPNAVVYTVSLYSPSLYYTQD